MRHYFRPQALNALPQFVKKAETKTFAVFCVSAVNAYFFSAKYPGASCGKIA
jgi:hypothetical protein